MTTRRISARARIAVCLWTATLLAAPAAAQPDGPQTTLTATTANMTPAGARLRIVIVRWSDPEGRAAAVAALAGSGESGDTETALTDLPTAGFIWTGGSLGYALKYAHRETTADGGERIVVVTDRPLGAWDRGGAWRADGRDTPPDGDATVVELWIDAGGAGSGTMSLVAPVAVDRAAGAVALRDAAGAPVLLDHARREP